MAVKNKFPMNFKELAKSAIEEIKQINLLTFKESRIERAKNYLCYNFLPIEKQLVLIDKQAEIDDSIILDDVSSDVIVFGKVLGRFTVEEFLKEIN